MDQKHVDPVDLDPDSDPNSDPDTNSDPDPENWFTRIYLFYLGWSVRRVLPGDGRGGPDAGHGLRTPDPGDCEASAAPEADAHVLRHLARGGQSRTFLTANKQ